MELVQAIDNLEDALARYFGDKDVPMDIARAISDLEIAMIEAGLSPLSVSRTLQGTPNFQ